MATIGILGGTFDPPHNGHLLLAESALAQFDLDCLVFMPAGDPYRKADRGVSAVDDRLAMTRLATRDDPRFEVDDREARRNGATYTAETLESLRAAGMKRPLFILGVDALRDMPNWHRPERIIELAEIVIAAKGASADEIRQAAETAGFGTTPELVDMPELDVSSTMIRELVAEGRPIRSLVPRAVEDYILDHRLYVSQSGATTV